MKRLSYVALIILGGICFPVLSHGDAYWVFFADRGDLDVSARIQAKRTSPDDPKNRGRRARILGPSRLFNEMDVTVYPPYVDDVASRVDRVRTVSRWFNAVTVDATPGSVDDLKGLPFVRAVEPVASFSRTVGPAQPSLAAPMRPEALSYGNSFDQISMVGVKGLHDLGYFGEGVMVGILDSGFDGLDHAAFDSLRVANSWDFIDRDDDITGDDHGTEVLAIMGGIDHGSLIGQAPHATYILARTEDRDTELRVEEDYWIAGIEWADSLGADIVNSSLGYNEFDDGFSYSYSDMDGRTARTTIAADLAVDRGISVITSAGNEGDNEWYYITSPADGFGVIAVGSVDRDKFVSTFSSRGPTYDGRVKPDFVALGEPVWTVDASSSSSYRFVQGTSFAAPSVSGAVALLLEVHPEWSPETVADSLRAYATSIAPDSLAGYGVIDAYASSGLKVEDSVSDGFVVYDPYPQPIEFTDAANRLYFPMDVPDKALLKITIYNFAGENVRSFGGDIEPGSLRERGSAPSWDGTNHTGDDVSPGVYFYSIELAGYGTHTGKIAVMR